MPIITLEVMSHLPHINKNPVDGTTQTEHSQDSDGLHLLTENEEMSTKTDDKDDKESIRATSRSDLLEYLMRNDGSVICKLCGEVLQSRTHWYRHKYKLHVIQPMNPAPLFQCEVCLVYFKSRKGYIGHLASRHSEVLSDAYPVLSNSQAESIGKEKILIPTTQEVKEELEEDGPSPAKLGPVMPTSTTKQSTPKATEGRRSSRISKDSSKSDWEEKRSKEEKLVAEIIDRVKRECEAQGIGSARRGYTRRTTAMHS